MQDTADETAIDQHLILNVLDNAVCTVHHVEFASQLISIQQNAYICNVTQLSAISSNVFNVYSASRRLCASPVMKPDAGHKLLSQVTVRGLLTQHNYAN